MLKPQTLKPLHRDSLTDGQAEDVQNAEGSGEVELQAPFRCLYGLLGFQVLREGL